MTCFRFFWGFCPISIEVITVRTPSTYMHCFSVCVCVCVCGQMSVLHTEVLTSLNWTNMWVLCMFLIWRLTRTENYLCLAKNCVGVQFIFPFLLLYTFEIEVKLTVEDCFLNIYIYFCAFSGLYWQDSLREDRKWVKEGRQWGQRLCIWVACLPTDL